MTPLEKLGVAVIVLATLIAVAVIAWQLLRPSKVPPRVVTEWKTTVDEHHDWDGEQAATYARLLGLPSHHVQVFDGRRLRAFDDLRVSADRAEAWRPLPEEGTRIAFCRMLEGGPDYYHQGV